jgi:hypothetical protein
MDNHGILAERALLGAVLLDPAGQQHVLHLVQRDDMERPYHGQVLTAMQRLRDAGQIPGPLEVYEEVKKDPDLPRSVSHDGLLLTDLMEAAPRSSHASAYAAMVIECGIRRRLSLAGSRMTQAAADSTADLDAALHVAWLAHRDLHACRARWQALPDHMRRDLPLPRHDDQENAETALLRQDVRAEIRREHEEHLASMAGHLAQTVAATGGHRERETLQDTAGEARPQDDEAEAAGAHAVRELAVGSASQIAEVARWLEPSHFARPDHGELYAVIRDLHAAGMPVDPVTIGREAARRGIRADTADLTGGMGPLGVLAAREVHRHGLLARIAVAGQGIQSDAANRALSPRLLIVAVGGRLDAVGREAYSEDQARSARPPGQRDAIVTSAPGRLARHSSMEPGREAVR